MAILAALALWEIAYFRFRAWYRRNERQAPQGLQLAIIGIIVAAILLAAANLVPLNTSIPFAAALSLVAAVWGWVRYHQSSHLRRWQTTWQQVEAHLEAGDQAGADRIMNAAHEQDDAERERLRAAAPSNKQAAIEFQRRTKTELDALTQTAMRFPTGSTGDVVFSARRQRLQADLEWVRTIVTGSSGAA